MNLNFGLRFLVFFGPLVIVVSGAAGGGLIGVLGVCTVKDRVATAELPAPSVAWTRKV